MTGPGKRRWDLWPFGAARIVLEVIEFGARKYAENDWIKHPPEVYRDALFRHAEKMMVGEMYDEESGLPHAAHAACNALFYLVLTVGTDENAPF
jgi:hypothetical protein